jgi:cyanate permease
VNPAHASVAGGLTAAAQSLAYVVANPIVGKVHDATQSYTPILIVLGVINVPGAIAWVLWPVERKR